MGGLFKSPKVPKPVKPPPPEDVAKTQLNALAYAETQKKLRKTSGRKGTIMTGAGGIGGNSFLGQ